MSKPKDPEAKRIAKLARIAQNSSKSKKVRKAAAAEHEALVARRGAFVPSEAPGRSADSSAPIAPADNRHARQDAEVAAQWAHQRQRAVDALTTELNRILPDLYDLVAPTPVPDDYRLSDPTGIGLDLIVDAGLDRPEEASGKDVPTPPAGPAQEAVEVQTDHGREFAVGTATEPLLPLAVETPADPVLENGNGQPVIHYLDPVTGKEKVKGYTRVTTYIKGLEDTTVLEKWKMRTLLEGGAVELLQSDGDSPSLATVARAVKRLDEALADIDSREKIEGELLGLRRAELLADHRRLLEGIAENLLELGGAHEKANKGTDLHRLTEIVDNGQPLPEGTSASDRRDVEAYQAKMAELGITTLWTERRVVLDDIQVSGTMDRAYLVKLPEMRRRIRVVGDLKTGSVSWGQGKIGMQLRLYAEGLGYDWAKPLERERLNLSRAHGLLVHLPQGEGVCTVYDVDLELAAQGLALARQVREWRNVGKRVYDLKKPLVSPA